MHIVGLSASIENGNVRFWLFVATAMAPVGQVARPMTPPKMDGRVDPTSTSMKSGKPDVATVDRRDMDADDLVRIGIVVSVDRAISRAATSAATGSREDEPRACQGRGVRGILFVAPLDQHAADIERKGGNEQQGDQPTCEQDEDLAALIAAVTGRLVVDDKARLRCHGDGRKRDERDQARVRVTGRHGHGGTACVVTIAVGREVAGRVPPAPVDRDAGGGHAEGGLTDTCDDVVAR